MVAPALKIIWSNQAKRSLQEIYDYYKEITLQGAINVRTDLLNAPKKIVYSKQYQRDDVNSKYYRIIVRDYKILYVEHENLILIVDIFSTRQSPNILQGM